MAYPKNYQEYIDPLWLEAGSKMRKQILFAGEKVERLLRQLLVSLVLGTSCIDHRFPNHHDGTQKAKTGRLIPFPQKKSIPNLPDNGKIRDDFCFNSPGC
jgi:hypothetical protein